MISGYRKLLMHHINSSNKAWPRLTCSYSKSSKHSLKLICAMKTKGVQKLQANNLRLISKTSTDVLSKEEKPLNYYEDAMLSNKYPEIFENLSLIDIRYQWALLKTFNKYLAPAVPYINNSLSISDIPTNTVPLTLSAYMSFSRNLCLMNVKFDLRHLILEKTSA